MTGVKRTLIGAAMAASVAVGGLALSAAPAEARQGDLLRDLGPVFLGDRGRYYYYDDYGYRRPYYSGGRYYWRGRDRDDRWSRDRRGRWNSHRDRRHDDDDDD
jgi:hypothetical protein